MRRIIIAKLMVFLLLGIAGAQTRSDVCHVYGVDVEKARKASESFRETGSAEADAKAMSVGQTVFPEFRPLMGEEELTTKTYRLPVGVALSGNLAYGQGSLGAIPKKARTLEDYKPSTLKKIAARDAKRDELLPFRVRVIYEVSVRPISKTSNDALHHWAQCCAGNPDHYTKAYISEMHFVENGAAYWLPVQDRLVADFQKELKSGEAVDLFLIRVSARGTNGKSGSVLLVERFQRVEPNNDQVKGSLDWIRSNLPSYTEKNLKVQVTGPCQLRING